MAFPNCFQGGLQIIDRITLLQLHTGLPRFLPIVVEWTIPGLGGLGLAIPCLSVPGLGAPSWVTGLVIPHGKV
jgi:hypothetical protein